MDAHDMPRFTMRAFLRDKAPILALACAVIAFVSFMLVVLGMTTDAILLIDFTLVAVLILAFILEYRRRALFWKSIGEALESLDKTRYFDEIVHEPAFLEGCAPCAVGAGHIAEGVTGERQRNIRLLPALTGGRSYRPHYAVPDAAPTRVRVKPVPHGTPSLCAQCTFLNRWERQ